MSENQPEPFTEDPELEPGGPDSVEDPKYGDSPDEPLTRDLDPDRNPAVEDAAPDEVKEPDEKSQEPDSGTSGEDDVPDDEESPA